MASRVQYKVLNNGMRIPSIGMGTYLAPRTATRDAVDCALDVGYRHIDTAVSYENESEIGSSISRSLRLGKFTRKDVFVTTKVPSIHLSPGDVEPCVLSALDRLQLKYVDLLLIHHPWGLQNLQDGNFRPVDADGNVLFANYDLCASWRAFESIVAKGYAKAIGLSNFNAKQIQRITSSSRLRPANIQLECHAFHQQIQLRSVCKRHGFVVTGYAPLGSPGRPANRKSSDDPDLLCDFTVKRIAEDCRKTPAQILIRYMMHIGVIPLPKSTTEKRIIENFEAQHFDLADEQIRVLAHLNRNYRYFKFPWAKGHPEFDEGSDF